MDKQGKTQQALAKAEGHHNKNIFFFFCCVSILCQWPLNLNFIFRNRANKANRAGGEQWLRWCGKNTCGSWAECFLPQYWITVNHLVNIRGNRHGLSNALLTRSSFSFLGFGDFKLIKKKQKKKKAADCLWFIAGDQSLKSVTILK